MKTLSDYEVISVIGSGSFGTCFKVRDKETGELFAWKAVDYNELSDSKQDSLVSEINVLRQLKHPNIVEYYDQIISKETKTIFIVMELCEGGDLSQLIAKCRDEKLQFEEKYIWRVLYQVCRALQVCHNKLAEGTVLHRDIKPANVFLDTSGNAKLGDFGLARILKRNEGFAETIVGTPYYMSPEIVKGSKYDRKSDVWAVGCLVYEMCALRPPFQGRQMDQLSRNISDGKYRSIPENYSKDLKDIISFMIEVNNDNRPNIDTVLRHPVLIRNVTGTVNTYPTLVPGSTRSPSCKLDFSPKEDFTSTIISQFSAPNVSDRRISGVSTPSLRAELFGSIRKRMFSNSLTELHETTLTNNISPIKEKNTASPYVLTKNIFDEALSSRLQAIRAHESLLKQKEINLLEKEKQLNEREKRVLAAEEEMLLKKTRLDLWICMEVMDSSLDKFYPKVFKNNLSMSEDVLGKVGMSVVSALHYLHVQLKVIHRDVKPSNILINRKGEVKMCDFGISGYLVDSVAKTIDAGCKPYMAPERIDPTGNPGQYDIRSDVWSLGITMFEVATGQFPYKTWRTPFEQLKQVVTDEPPRLVPGQFSEEFEDLITSCLQKKCVNRPNYEQLLAKPFIAVHRERNTDISAFVEQVLDLPDEAK